MEEFPLAPNAQIKLVRWIALVAAYFFLMPILLHFISWFTAYFNNGEIVVFSKYMWSGEREKTLLV